MNLQFRHLPFALQLSLSLAGGRALGGVLALLITAVDAERPSRRALCQELAEQLAQSEIALHEYLATQCSARLVDRGEVAE